MVIEEHAALDVITKDGSTYAIDESQIIRGSLTTSQSCSSGGGIPAGSCNTGTASVAFHAPSALSYEKLFGAKVKLYVWYGDTSKKQVGVYNVTSTERSYGVYTLSLSDNVYLLDEACYSNDTTTAAQNWLAMQLGEKKVPSVIFNMICNAYSVPHWNAAKNEESVPESGIGALSVKVPSDCCTESVKDFANYLAEYLGAIIMPDENGELHFAYMGSRTCPITIDASNIERDTYQKSPFHVSTSSWRVNHDSGIWTSWSVSGDFPDNAAPLSIVVNNNPFWQSVEDGTPESMVRGRTETMLRYMWVAQGRVAYIDNVPQINPFRCTVHVPYYFRAGDRVKIIDPITSEVYHSYVTDVTWTLRGGQQISCAGEDTRTLSVSTSRNGAKKMSDYSRYLYRKSKSNTGSGDANTYTKAEIDAKDATVKSAADKAQGTADGAVSVNNTQNTQISALQKSAHTHSNKGVLDKIEQPYTTAERDKLAGLENYTHPEYTEHSSGLYEIAIDHLGHVTFAHEVGKSTFINMGLIGSEFSPKIKSTDNNNFDCPILLWDGKEDCGGSIEVLNLHISNTKSSTDVFSDVTLEIGNVNNAQKVRSSILFRSGVYSSVELCGPIASEERHHHSVYLPSDTGVLALEKNIPKKVSKLENDSGYGTYTKPAAGIPKSDLASGVQASLGKADTALQKHQDISGKQDKLTAGANVMINGNTISAKDTTYSDATQSAHGLMSAADKKKLDGIAAGATKVAVDSALSATSTNPVQNKAVKAALDSKSASGHTHAMITNSALWVSGANNTAKWVKLGTLVSSGNFSNAMIRVWSGDGANGRANQNSSFEVQIKDGWQSTESATKACGVTVYRINCSSVKVKVIPTAHDTYTVWAYMPWGYWNGNYAIYGKYKSWTSQHLIQSEEPEGTGADTAYYDHAFLTSTVAKATEATTLTDSGWIDTTRNTSFTVTSTVKCRKYGQLVEVRGEVTFSSTYGSPTVCTLPAGYRPAAVVQTCGYTPSGKIFGIKVDTAGVVSFSSDAAGTFVKSTTYRIDLTYLLG